MAKEAKKTKAKSNKVKKEGIITKVKTFFHEVSVEMGKVRWPDKKEMFTYATATIGFVILFALFFLGTDAVITMLKELMN